MAQVMLDEEGRRVGPRGRTPIGPAKPVRLPAELLAAVDAEAGRIGVSRAAMIRKLVALGLGSVEYTRWLRKHGRTER